jgi:hypothetical protein
LAAAAAAAGAAAAEQWSVSENRYVSKQNAWFRCTLFLPATNIAPCTLQVLNRACSSRRRFCLHMCTV